MLSTTLNAIVKQEF